MDEQTIRTYDQLAKEYDNETTDFWNKFPRDFVDTFAARLKKGYVLDIGSGPGRDGVLLREAGLKVTCLDASASMVKMSHERGLHSVQGDFLHLPFADSSFDGVWSYTALLHIQKALVHTAIAEIARVLKPGGILGLGLIEGEGELYKESAGVGKPRLFAYYKEDEMLELLRAHGLDPTLHSSFKPRSSRYLHFLAIKISSRAARMGE